MSEEKQFLTDQLEWVMKQDDIYGQIEQKLHEMKAIAEYCAVPEVSDLERQELQLEIGKLKEEIFALEQELGTFHH
ncbi:hypothetical protein [Alteribacter populi]|uniref:hypothetical protein n=1 Tax=Alteribacter populi TaxID=2011011 RepID=UPI000BBB3932|nr:hypothetical protein [Alteribacter populi]